MSTPSWFARQTTHTPATEARPARSIAQRRAALAEIETAKAEWERDSQRLEARAATTRARAAEIAELLREARDLELEAAAAALAASLAHDVKIGVLEQRLRAGAPESLDRFQSEVLAEEARTRLAFSAWESRGKLDPVTMERPLSIKTNAASIEARLTALRAARVAAEALKLQPLDETAVAERLHALHAAIPEVEAVELNIADQISPAARRVIEWRPADRQRPERWSGGEV